MRDARAVSAGEIIREIERLSSQEKAEVLSALLRSQPNKSKLSPGEVVALADQMVAAKDLQIGLKRRFLRAFTAAERCPGFSANKDSASKICGDSGCSKSADNLKEVRRGETRRPTLETSALPSPRGEA